MKRALAALSAGALVFGSAMAGATAAVAAPPVIPAGCAGVGNIAPNPSVEQVVGGAKTAPTGYTFTGAAPVPNGTPSNKIPKLYTDGTYPSDGATYALIQTPDKMVSTAYQAQKFVPGGIYTLTDFTGTHAENLSRAGDNQFTGLRFYDAANKVVLENKLKVTHDVNTDKKVARQDFPASTAPAAATSVRFFAETNYNWVKWDCVYLQLAAYSVKKEVQDPATGAWGPKATITAGQTAKYRITVTNEGSVQLKNLKVDDPWCATQPAPIATLDGGKNQVITCDHPNVTIDDDGHVNTVTVSGVTSANGDKLGDKTATATIIVKTPPAIDKVGDFVWVDTNRNGLQDSGEAGVPGVKVTLKDGAGKDVGTPKTTDAQGKYLFDKLPDGDYTVCFDVANLPKAVAEYKPTKKDAGDDTKDSDAGADGCTAKTTLNADKREDMTLDLGLTPPVNRLGDFVWADTNKNGLQDSGEPGVQGIKVTLKGAATATTTTGADGKYLFDNLNDGTYNVCFDLANLPAQYAGYLVTKKDSGDDAKDSDAGADGCTASTTLGAAKREDLTLDGGIITPPDKIGDFVWVDTNRNGLQDSGEPGVPGVKVTLQDGGGTLVTTTTTGPDGKYLFPELNDGTYKVCFDVAHLPADFAGHQVTKKDGGDDAKDSDADAATGCTPTTTVGAGKREDLTLDLGVVPPLNRLGDFVWADTNKNGLQDAGEPGVPGVKVTLKGTDFTTTTGPDGKYLFTDLPDGAYTVCFETTNLPAPYTGHQLTKVNAGDVASDSDADPATGCAKPATLGAAKREDLTLDAGIASPPNKLGDFVWIDTNKNGLQDAGELGVQGVKVTLQGTDVSTTTGADGKYLFDNLNDGTYTVCFDIAKLPAAVAGYQITKKNASDVAKDSDADPASGCTGVTTLGVAKREDLTLDAGLIAPVNRLGDFVWIDANKNGLQDSGEAPVPGVTVTLKGAGKTATTDKDGKYLFDNLDDGTYTVCFDIAKLPAAVTGYQVTKKDSGDDAKDSDAGADGCAPPLVLGADKHEDLTLDLGLVSPPNKLGDYVWADTDRNGLQDSGEPAVPGVKVTLKGTDLTTTTGPDGKYLFDNLSDGKYTVCFDVKALPQAVAGYQVTKPNAGDATKDSDADAATGCTPEVTLGQDKREDLTVDAGLIQPVNRLGDFVWIDTDKNGLQDAGEPGVEGVKVTLQGTDVTTTTDKDGKYLLDNLKDGTYTVCFEVKDHTLTKLGGGDVAKDSDADPATGCAKPTTLGAAKREDLTLDAGLVAPVNKLGDYVWVDANRDGLQSPGEAPVQGVKVTLQGTDKSTVTDAQGKYGFGDLPDGTYTVCFDLKGLPGQYADYQVTKPGADSDADMSTGCAKPVKLGAGNREDLTLDMGIVAPVNRLGDYVWVDTNANGIQDPSEKGAPGVKVTLKDTDKSVTTDKDGKYVFGDLPDGSYQVCFEVAGEFKGYTFTKPNAASHNGTDSAADPASKCAPVTKLGPGKREDLTLDAGLVEPKVTPVNKVGDFVWYDTNKNGIQDQGEPGVEDVKVILKEVGGEVVSSTTTNPQGKYLFDNLKDGEYQVCFDLTSLPAEYQGYAPTKADAARHNGKDSAMDPASKCTPVTKLGVAKREDLTLDAGLIGGHSEPGTTPGKNLAKTGAPIGFMAGIGALLLAGGLVLTVGIRRRTRG
ncbi:SdrD B-like domain-containing protein [Amycolatopsis sp. NPDC059657]|uniref:SdrD B-like domain-containing protein n=1 Tax=Amycolatopsis sp. NPDC059657 TaxID=3346899 RepID=UPI00366BF262